jgi:hypothetical protein
VFGWEAAAP